jgi:type IV fimbrial biogenesis protein FimT
MPEQRVALPADRRCQWGTSFAHRKGQVPVRLDRSRGNLISGDSGFTLLELIVGITIAAILTALTVPSFLKTVQTNRGVSDANAVLAVITLARSEAIKRDSTVTLCASTDGSTCSTSASWDSGFLAYIDANGDGTYDSSPTPPDILLRAEVPLSGASTINLCSGTPSTSAGTAAYSISFKGTGQTSSQGYFDINPTTKSGTACPPSTAAKAIGERYVVVKVIGRANICNPTDTNCGQ